MPKTLQNPGQAWKTLATGNLVALRRRILPLAFVLGLIVAASSAQAACRQALALALDVSGSVDSREYRMQLGGLASALLHPEVRNALLSMPDTPVRIAIFEWSGPNDQVMMMNWREVNGPDDLSAIASKLSSATRVPAEKSTALGQAMLFGAKLLEEQSACWRRTLDISGDGKSNTGPNPQAIPDAQLGGITINALVIGSDAWDHGDARQAEISELSSYFNAHVIRGFDSFVEVALGFEDYEAAMVRKLKKELDGLAVSSADPTLSHSTLND